MSHVFPQHVLAAITLLRNVVGDVGIRVKARCKLGFSLYSMASSNILGLGLVLKRWSSNPDFGSTVAPLPLTSWAPSPLSTSTLTAKGSSACSHAAEGLICHCLSQLRSPFGCDSYYPGLELCKEMATHSSTLAWKIPWMEKPGRLQSMGSQRVGHNWATSHTVKQVGLGSTPSSDLSRCHGYHRTSAASPSVSIHSVLPVLRVSKLLHSLQEWSPGFSQPSCWSRQPSNQPRILTFPMLNPRARSM